MDCGSVISSAIVTDAPPVFISYSHDSPEHKRWVAMLATRLREKGIDALLDQWDLTLGDDPTRFMEDGVHRASRVLVICTPEYLRKASDGRGGVGYERLIVTAELVHDVGTRKFIPIVRRADGAEKTPKFLGPRIYADFSDDAMFDEEFDRLVHELHGVPPVQKPPLGPSPFAPAPVEALAAPAVPEAALPPPVALESAEDPARVYRTAMDLIRQGDLVGWRLQAKKLRRTAFEELRAWHLPYAASGPPREKEAAEEALSRALSPLAPLFALALAAVESGHIELRSQRALLDELLTPPGWPAYGVTTLIDYPKTFVYIYQALHGATCLHTGQADLAITLVETPLRQRREGKYMPLWRDGYAIGWPPGLPENCIWAWEFLQAIPARYPWLLEIFDDQESFLTALSAYYMALNVFELAWTIPNQPAALQAKQIRLEIPPLFFLLHDKLDERPVRLLMRNRDAIRSTWTSLKVTEQAMRDAWPAWMEHDKAWMLGLHRFWMSDPPHAAFLKDLA